VDSSFKQPETRRIRNLTTYRAIALLCVALAVVALSVPLLLTLPRTLDAVASPMSAAEEASASDSSLSQQSSARTAESWVDTLEEGEIAQWRMRASD
jgi:hypothetical protein